MLLVVASGFNTEKGMKPLYNHCVTYIVKTGTKEISNYAEPL